MVLEENRAQSQTESQTNQNESERNHTSPTRASHELNDNATDTNNDTTSSLREWRAGHYELDLALSVKLYPSDKEHSGNDTINEPADSDSGEHSQNERHTSERSDVNRAARSFYKSLKSTKKRIDRFVKWYRRELERRNMI